MTWEKGEMRVVLSIRTSRARTDKDCAICGMEIPKGWKHTSVGILDRMEGTRERWYCCQECGQVFEYGSAENAPEYVQRYLLENRFTDEVWIND